MHAVPKVLVSDLWPQRWDEAEAWQLGNLFQYEVYATGELYGFHDLSSSRHKGLRTKDDSYIMFNYYYTRYVQLPLQQGVASLESPSVHSITNLDCATYVRM